MMSGPRIAKNYVSNYLSNDLPARLLTYRNHLNLSSSQLPDPSKMLTHEPFTLGKWPTIINMVMNTLQIERQGYAYDHDPNYRVLYAMRTYIWVRASGEQVVTEQRDNLTTVVREALLDGPSLSRYDTTVPCYPKVDEGSMREEFSEITLVKGERCLAGAFVSYDLQLEETIDHDALGIMLQADPTVSKISILPSKPYRLLGILGDAKVTLSWEEPMWDGGVFPITGYIIQQSTDGTNWSTIVADTGNTDTGKVVTGLTNGQDYYFRVAALNRSGTGEYSTTSNDGVAIKPSA
jgi:hypothetical protein